MYSSVKRKLVIGVAVLAAAAFAGGAFAATQEKPVSPRQAFINDVAKRLNVSPQKLTSAIRGAFLDELNTAVAKGKLTKAQASVMRERIQRTGALPLAALFGLGALSPMAAGPPLMPPQALFGGRARTARPRIPLPALPLRVFRGRRPRFFALPYPGLGIGLFGAIGAAGKYLGTTPAKLLSQLRSGKSLAQIAAADGKSVAGLEAAVVAQRRALLDTLVAAKRLTSTQEASIIARFEKRLVKLVARAKLLLPFAGGRLPFGGPPAAWAVP